MRAEAEEAGFEVEHHGGKHWITTLQVRAHNVLQVFTEDGIVKQLGNIRQYPL